MPAFVTVDRDPRVGLPVLAWEERDGRFVVASRHASLDGVDADVEAFAFDVETTLSTGVAGNEGLHPTVDVDGAPLWHGARVEFCVPTFYVNTVSGSGSFVGVDRYGGARYVSDVPMPVIVDRDGGWTRKATDRYSPFSGYDREGPLAGHRRLSGDLGDPFEHGVTKTFLRLASDPREACSPLPRTAPSP